MCIRDSPLFTMSYIGVNGGMVLAVADDPGMHSSQNEQDSRNYARAAKVPMVEPADSKECRDSVSYTHLDVYKRQAMVPRAPYRV